MGSTTRRSEKMKLRPEWLSWFWGSGSAGHLFVRKTLWSKNSGSTAAPGSDPMNPWLVPLDIVWNGMVPSRHRNREFFSTRYNIYGFCALGTQNRCCEGKSTFPGSTLPSFSWLYIFGVDHINPETLRFWFLKNIGKHVIYLRKQFLLRLTSK